MKGLYIPIVAAAVAVVLFSVLTLPSVQLFLSPTAKVDQNNYIQANDPKKGSLFPVPANDAFGRPVLPDQENIVVIAGSCSSCSLNSIDPQRLLPKPGQKFIFVYQMSAKNLPSWAHRLSGSVRVVADLDGALSKRANAVWKPRYIRLDSNSRVIDLSDNLSGMPTYVHIRS